MPSFRLPADPVPLVIDEGPWSGVEVEVNRANAPRAELIGLLTPPARETAKAALARGTELFNLLDARVILGWNVENQKGHPIPANVDGFALVPPDLIATIIAAYLDQTAG